MPLVAIRAQLLVPTHVKVVDMRLSSRALALAASLSLVAVTAVSATATTADSEVVTRQVNSGVGITAAPALSAADYWTADRMASAATKAAPQYATADDVAVQVGIEESVFVEGVAPAADMSLALLPADNHDDDATPEDEKKQYAPTSGVLFFVHDDNDYACSASVIRSDEGNAVVTAGHCLFDDEKWSDFLLFAPGYDGATTPFGLWEIDTAAVPHPFMRRGLAQYDIGIVRVTELHDKKLQDIVGANGYTTGSRGREHNVLALGFDVESDDDGYLEQCEGDTEPSRQAAENTERDRRRGVVSTMPCDFTETAHGGPWLLEKHRSGTVGVAFALTQDSDGDVIYGRPFDRTLVSLLSETGKKK